MCYYITNLLTSTSTGSRGSGWQITVRQQSVLKICNGADQKVVSKDIYKQDCQNLSLKVGDKTDCKLAAGEGCSVRLENKLAEEKERSEVLDITLSDRFWGMVGDSGRWCTRPGRGRHQSTDAGVTGTASGGGLCDNVSPACVPLGSGMTCLCIIACNASLRDCDGPVERPSNGLSKGTCVGVRRPSTEVSECEAAKEDWIDVETPPTRPS